MKLYYYYGVNSVNWQHIEWREKKIYGKINRAKNNGSVPSTGIAFLCFPFPFFMSNFIILYPKIFIIIYSLVIEVLLQIEKVILLISFKGTKKKLFGRTPERKRCKYPHCNQIFYLTRTTIIVIIYISITMCNQRLIVRRKFWLFVNSRWGDRKTIRDELRNIL